MGQHCLRSAAVVVTSRWYKRKYLHTHQGIDVFILSFLFVLMSDISLRIYFLLMLDPFIIFLLRYVFSLHSSGIKLFARYWIGPGEEPACYMVII